MVDRNEKNVLDFDRPPDGLRLPDRARWSGSSASRSAGLASPARNFLKAWEDAKAHTDDMTIQADRITYDSHKELFYAYGEDAREVTSSPSRRPASPLVGTGRTSWYNRGPASRRSTTPRASSSSTSIPASARNPSGPTTSCRRRSRAASSSGCRPATTPSATASPAGNWGRLIPGLHGVPGGSAVRTSLQARAKMLRTADSTGSRPGRRWSTRRTLHGRERYLPVLTKA